MYSSKNGKVMLIHDLIAQEELEEKGHTDRKSLRGVGDKVLPQDRLFLTGVEEVTMYTATEKALYKKVRDNGIVIYGGKENPLIPGKELETIARDIEYKLVSKEPYNMKEFYDDLERQVKVSLKENS